MKKIYLLAVMAAMFVGFTACSDEDPASPVNYQENADVSNYKTATIKGVAYCYSNETLDSEVKQYAPSGTKLFLSIASLNYYVESTVGANGAFEFVVPADINGATSAMIKTDNVQVTYTPTTGTPETQVWSGSSLVSGLQPNGTSYVEITMFENGFGPF